MQFQLLHRTSFSPRPLTPYPKCYRRKLFRFDFFSEFWIFMQGKGILEMGPSLTWDAFVYTWTIIQNLQLILCNIFNNFVHKATYMWMSLGAGNRTLIILSMSLNREQLNCLQLYEARFCGRQLSTCIVTLASKRFTMHRSQIWYMGPVLTLGLWLWQSVLSL